MAINRKRLEELFEQLGASVQHPTTLCIFGSAPGILLGQPTRQTQDVDVWHPRSTFDAGDLARACSSIGVLFNPTGEVDPNAVYLQIVRPGFVALPTAFEIETIGRWGNVTVVMPAPVVLSAAKLVRASENDVNDIVWWVRQRAITFKQIQQTIGALPIQKQRETARENLILVQLIVGREE